MSQSAEELRDRTKAFATRVVKMFRALPRSTDTYVLGKQVLRSGTSVAANYRAACRARSRAEFVARLGVVAEEADEAVFWLEMLVDCGIVKREKLMSLLTEARELTAIFSASQHTAKYRK
jgi:four helix bundle protein